MKTNAWFLMAFAVAGCVALVRAQEAPKDTTSLVGAKAPDIAIKSVDGADLKLADLKGKVVLLDFWATWCPPCRVSLPHLQTLSADKKLAKDGLVVWAANI